MAGYLFGGNTGETAESLRRKRSMAEAMLARTSSRTPQDLPEGITALSGAIAGRVGLNRANEGIEKGETAARQLFQNLVFGGGRSTQATGAPVEQQSGGGDFNSKLAHSESGGRYGIVNSEGYSGKYQFGQGRLDDFNRANRTNYKTSDLVQGTPDSNALTEQVQSWHVSDIDGFVKERGLDQFIGQNIGGVSVTLDGMRAMAHLGGKAGMEKFIRSGGQYNPADSNGTSLSDYGNKFAATPQARGAQQAISQAVGKQQPVEGDTNKLQRLLQAFNSPFMPAEQKAVLQQMINQEITSSAPLNPLEQAQLEGAQLRNEQMRNPAPDPVKAAQLENLQIRNEQLRNPIEKATDDMREYRHAKREGFKGNFLDYQTAVRKAGSNSVNVNTKGETEYDKTVGKSLAEKTINIIEAGQAAPAKIATLQAMQEAAQNSYTGAGGESVLKFRQLAKAVGIDAGDTSDAEFVRSIGNKIALELRSPAGGAGMPGAMSDKDREFLVSSVPGLTKSPEGNAKLIEYMLNIERRNIEVSKQAQDYADANGRLDRRFYSQLAEWSAKNPMFQKAPSSPDAKPISEMSDEELEALVNGG